MYLAGSFLMFLALLTVIGVLISDLALAALDPRIRLQAGRREDERDASSRSPTAAAASDAAFRLDRAVRPVRRRRS